MRGKGFTLIELLVTISILAILSSIALISFSNIQKNTRDAKRKSDLSTIQAALEQYHADLGYYPSTLPAAGFALSNGSKIYLSKIPGDNDGSNYSYTAKPDSCTTNCTNYCLYATIEISSNQTLAFQCGLTSGNYYSAVFGETLATFSFNFSEEYRSNWYTIDASTTPDMSWDVYGDFASGANSPIILNNANTRWDKYSCGRTLYWRIKPNNIGFTSPIQSTVVCGSTPGSAFAQYQVQAP